MRQKTLFSLVVLMLFLLVSGTSYAATTIVYDGGTNWSQGTNTGGVGIPKSSACGYDGNMRWVNGNGYSTEYVWGRWDYNVPFNTDISLQYQVYIPNCNSSASVNYWVIYGTQSTTVSVDQNQYVDAWVNLGNYFIPANKSYVQAFIKLYNDNLSNVYKVGFDEAAFAQD